jgi:hypothetical protein
MLGRYRGTGICLFPRSERVSSWQAKDSHPVARRRVGRVLGAAHLSVAVTRFEATDPTERLGLAVDAVTAHRARGSDGVRFEGHPVDADGDVAPSTVEYTDRVLRLELDDAARERLDDLLGAFPVFKLKQPETRKADAGVVYVSVIADAKHAAEFVDAVFREVHDLGECYELRVVRV